MSVTAKEDKVAAIREAAEKDLAVFIKLVAPHRVLAKIHEDVINWWSRPDAKSHQLLLLPRGHQKSILLAYRVAWWITRNPATTILYLSSTANLAEKQLKAVKDILTNPIYTRYWPKMVHPMEGQREKWSTSEISVDHPLRKTEGVRDPTVFTGGLTTSLTGMHCDVAVLDDVVVQENAYTKEGRDKVRTQYSLLSSIENPDALEWVAGTRYHPKDLYSDMISMMEDRYDDKGDLIDSVQVYEVMERKVESKGDGTGEFIWPRTQRHDGKWFGFNTSILKKKYAQYLDKSQFWAQYYNDPNVAEEAPIKADYFQYYDKKYIKFEDDRWYFKDMRLNVFAAIDFAFSLKKKADYTAIVIIGIDAKNNIYILDIDRFKTDGHIKDYFDHLLALHSKWGFRKVRAEISVAQKAIVKELKTNYIKEHGLALSIDEVNPTHVEGNKRERVLAILQPRYENGAVWHFKGGITDALEEELTMKHPPHDDVMDALAYAVDVAVPPTGLISKGGKASNVVYHNRFGGVKFA